MSNDAIVKNLLPEAFVAQVRFQLPGTFLAAYGRDAFVLVEVAAQLDELLTVLYANAQDDIAGPGQGLADLAHQTLEHTRKSDTDSKTGPMPLPADPMVLENLRAQVRRRRHFIVPLRKRDLAATYSARVTVGRGRKMDIVLRHGSISKFHGWFEKDKTTNVFCATDAGSKNGTTVNDQPVAVRELMPLASGDVLRFGSVTMRYCLAETLGRLVSGE